ncbi:uncharacterized protein PHALS_12429 [Plasmopara halstedii]|uniref:Uncharacterized protein n=1 Tax=Plasmopara halstedii TaxID=4781 RepID=A0A0P1ALF4_PLAHL|nr:uncharacterized protein PHALS_12429 [Plasmopara halstedii]CEG42128.1 hypothetical protein PHALS_12429 [Plasmopara halstedii]|eukprot:XP_024578497.1 hypothetical protein PHALS_12429 [Plasmopara halstedii]
MFQKDEDKSTLAFILNPSSLPSAEVLHSPVHGSSVSLLPTISPINKSDLNDSISTEHDSVLSRSDYSLDKRMEIMNVRALRSHVDVAYATVAARAVHTQTVYMVRGYTTVVSITVVANSVRSLAALVKLSASATAGRTAVAAFAMSRIALRWQHQVAYVGLMAVATDAR